MKTEFTRQRKNLMSNYSQNALIKLIIVSSIGFILAYAMYVIILVISPDQKILVNGSYETVTFHNAISPYISLQPFNAFWHKPWILLTYAWAHSGFLNLLSNMLWLYCFGSVIQSLVGFKEVIPLFILSYLVGGIVFLAVTAAWPGIQGSKYILGALPGIIGFATAAITLAPKFRFYLGERLAIPLWILIAVFFILNVISFTAGNWGLVILCLASALTGFLYIKILRRGYKPGSWWHDTGVRVQSLFAPKEFPHGARTNKRAETFRQARQYKTTSNEDSIDQILDKINQKGFDSLTPEEKEALYKASKEN